MTKHATAIRAMGVVIVSLIVAALFYALANDVRMSVFIFLVTAFAGSLFTMISIVTKES